MAQFVPPDDPNVLRCLDVDLRIYVRSQPDIQQWVQYFNEGKVSISAPYGSEITGYSQRACDADGDYTRPISVAETAFYGSSLTGIEFTVAARASSDPALKNDCDTFGSYVCYYDVTVETGADSDDDGTSDINDSYPLDPSRVSPEVEVSESGPGRVQPIGTFSVPRNGIFSVDVFPELDHEAVISGCRGGSLVGNTYTFSVYDPCNLHVNFKKIEKQVTFIADLGGSFDPSGAQSIPLDDRAEAQVVADYGYEIASVEGCGGELSGTTFQTAPIREACEVRATFQPVDFLLTISSSDGGAVEREGALALTYGQSYRLGLVPDPGYAARLVEGDCNALIQDDELVISEVSGPCNLRVEFEPAYLVVFTQTGPGTINADNPSVLFAGEQLEFTVEPAENYFIKSVKGCSVAPIEDSANSYAPAVAGSSVFWNAQTCNIYVVFEGDPTFVTLSSSSNGALEQEGEFTVPYGDTLRIATFADDGYLVDDLIGTCAGRLEQKQLIIGPVTANCNLNVGFVRFAQVNVQVQGEFESALPASLTIKSGDIVTLDLIPVEGWQLYKVRGCNGRLTGDQYLLDKVIYDCDITVEALQERTVNVDAGPNGAVLGDASVTVLNGLTTQFQIVPDRGYEIDVVSGCGGRLADKTFALDPVTADCTLSVRFRPSVFSISVAPTENGSVTPSAVQNLRFGDTAEFTLYANDNYRAATISGCNYRQIDSRTLLVFDQSEDCELQVEYTLRDVYVRSRIAGQGDVVPEGGKDPTGTKVFTYGDAVTYQVLPAAGYDIQSVSGCDGALSGTHYSFTAMQTCTVDAIFAPTDETLLWSQLGSDMDGVLASDVFHFGDKVSMSADGSIVAGASFRNRVAVYQFDPQEGDWLQLGSDLYYAQDGDYALLREMKLSPDGKSLGIAWQTYAEQYLGHVAVYDWNGSAWTLRDSEISSGELDDFFGWSMGISQGGERLVVGTRDTQKVFVYDWVEADSSWLLAQTLQNNTNNSGQFGWSLDISANGRILAVGSPEYSVAGIAPAGRISVYFADADHRYGSETYASSVEGDTRLGESVRLGYDEATLVSVDAANSVKVFDLAPETIRKKGQTIAGRSAASAAAGRVLAVGLDDSYTSGRAVQIYRYNAESDVWQQVGANIQGEEPGSAIQESDDFGRTIALSELGDTLAVGAPRNDGGGLQAGHVRVLRRAVPLVPAYSVDFTVGQNGVLGYTGLTQVPEGGGFEFLATPDSEAYRPAVAATCGDLTALSEIKFRVANVANDCDVTLAFEPRFKIVTNVGAGGDIEVVSPEQLIQGAISTLNITPRYGYVTAKVQSQCALVQESDATWLLTQSVETCTVEAVFELAPLRVVLSSDGNGSWVAGTSLDVLYGQRFSSVLVPAAGFEVAGVDDGCGGGLTGDTYQSGPISDACEVTALFRVFVDTDSDGVSDFYDADDDADGVLDQDDAFPLDPMEFIDTDQDGLGNNADSDDDNDGFSDERELLAGTSPTIFGSQPPMCDRGSYSSDGYIPCEYCPPGTYQDEANQTQCDLTPPGYYGPNEGGRGALQCPTDSVSEVFGAVECQACGFFGTPNGDQTTCLTDLDADEIADITDNCAAVSNPDQVDTDTDGYGDACDAFYLDPAEYADSDQDGVGNNADPDDDNDGYSDTQELTDGTDPLDPNDFYVPSPLSGRVFHWSQHTLMGDVAIQRTTGELTASASTDGSGVYRFQQTEAGTHHLAASLDLSDADLNRTITSADALAALKIAVGINPNPKPIHNPDLDVLPVSPYQLIAADMNQDGRVTSADALAILKVAVGLSDGATPAWRFIPIDEPLWQTYSDKSKVYHSADGKQFEYPATEVVNFVTILVGDVNSSWSNPLGFERLADADLVPLVSDVEAPLSAFGVRDTDSDGLPDTLERELGTNPLLVDSDNDGVPDGADEYPLDPAMSKKAISPPALSTATPAVYARSDASITIAMTKSQSEIAPFDNLGTLYLTGDMNDWGETFPFEWIEGRYELQITLEPGYYAFRLTTESWQGLYFGAYIVPESVVPPVNYKLEAFAQNSLFIEMLESKSLRFVVELNGTQSRLSIVELH